MSSTSIQKPRADIAAKRNDPASVPPSDEVVLSERAPIHLDGSVMPSQVVQNAPSHIQRVQAVQSISRQIGNRATTRLIGQLQRHPEGAPLIPNDKAAVQEANNSRKGQSAQAPSRVGEDAGAVAGMAPAGPAAAPAGPAAAPAGPAGPAPAVLTNPTMQSAFAQNAIQTAFGTTAGRPMIAGSITVVADYAALGAAYDNWCIAHNVTNSRTGVTWVAGDMAADDAANHVRTNAFAEPAPGTGIFIDATGTDPTATVHEMLHINTGAGFRTTAGEVINEGTTQRFAVQAVQAQGASVAGSERTYQQEQGIVAKLVSMFGEATLRDAYFNTPASLVTAYEAVAGAGTWVTLKALLDARDFAAANTLLDAGIASAQAQAAARAKAVASGFMSAVSKVWNAITGLF